MKKFSDRGLATIFLIVLIIIGTIAIIVINNVYEVQSREWQQEQKIKWEENK